MGHARAPLLAALVAHAALAALAPLHATPARAQDTRAIQIREAQRTDERTFAFLAQFRAALAQRFGADPALSMLVFSESEGEALVHASPEAPAEHVIFQGGTWIATDGRQLKPWAPEASPAVARFRLSVVREPLLREKFRAHRAQPSKAADHLGRVTIGYFGPPFNRVLAEVMVGGMSPFGLSVLAFDVATGQTLDVGAAAADARAQRAAAQAKEAAAERAAAQRNLKDEVPAVLARFRREIGPERLMAVWIARQRITFVRTDRAVYDYDRRGTFTRRKDPYDQIWLCTEGFADGDVDWSGMNALVDKAMLARNLDDEDRAPAEIAVERPRDCAPTVIEVKFVNYKTPWPYVTFDAKGRLGKVR